MMHIYMQTTWQHCTQLPVAERPSCFGCKEIYLLCELYDPIKNVFYLCFVIKEKKTQDPKLPTKVEQNGFAG